MKKLLCMLLIASCSLFLSCEDTNSQLFNIMLEIKAQNDKLINEVKDLQSKSDLLISELRASAAKQQELLEKVTDLQKQLTTILTQIGLLNQELKNQNADLQKVRTQLADLQSKYQTIVEELVELRKLSLVLSEIEKLKLQLNKLDQQYVTISANMIDNKAKLDALRIQITAIQNQIAESLNRISQLTSLLSNQGVDIKSILSQISLLKDKIDELKTDLSNLIKRLSPITLSVANLDFESAEIQDTTKWQYVAVLFHTDRRTEIYINGVKKVDNYRSNVNYNFTKLYLGASYFTSFTDFYNGTLDELRISNRIRSQKEIQDYYTISNGADGVQRNARQKLDNSTIGLWHFDESSPRNNFLNSVTGTNAGTLFGNTKFIKGISGNSLYFDGITGLADCNFNLPETNMTIEFWFKTSTKKSGTLIQPYGMYSSNIQIHPN